MVLYSLPSDREGQKNVCVALENCQWLDYGNKDECKRIKDKLSMQELDMSERSFLENLISQFGSRIEI